MHIVDFIGEDDDLLDESARRILGYAEPEEYMIPISELEQLISKLH